MTDWVWAHPAPSRVVISYDHNDLPVKEVFEDAKQNPVRQVIMRRGQRGETGQG